MIKAENFIKRNLDLLNRRISLQEEIKALKRMEMDLKWSVTERILLLSAELLKVEDSEISTNFNLDPPHDTG